MWEIGGKTAGLSCNWRPAPLWAPRPCRPGVAKALALPANHVTGTIKDVEHVVILMQENRSFDHYFGTLRGVRGFGDPRPIDLPSGQPVWKQPAPKTANGDGASSVSPFHLDTATTRAETHVQPRPQLEGQPRDVEAPRRLDPGQDAR